MPDAFQTKKSVMALVEETTEGTPISPSSATDYTRLQEGFSLTPDFETLENAELTGSIGNAKPVQGFEEPSASFSHYLKHSGVEGQEPDYGILLEAAWGDKDVHAVEDDVVSATAGTSSAAATVTVDTGEGADYERGKALLVKDGTNGYQIRNVKSVAGDVLTLAQNFPGSAPAAGVDLGLPVLYKPGEDHPTFTTWMYRANEAAVEMIAGTRVTEMSIEVEAGQFINSSFSMEGIKYSFNPLEITATTNDLDVTDDGGAFSITLPTGIYRDPHEAAADLEAKLNTGGTDTFSVVYNDSGADAGKFTVNSDGTTLDLDWLSTTDSLGPVFGFTADDTGGGPYTSDDALDLTSPQSPSYDSSDPLVAKDNEVLLGDFADTACFSVQSLTFTLSDEKTDQLSVCAESGKEGSLITSREASVELVANISQYDVDQFKRFRANDETQFTFNAGTKVGGNWEAGKSLNLFLPTCTISSFELSDNDGLVTLEMTLSTYVDSDGNGEVYLNFL